MTFNMKQTQAAHIQYDYIYAAYHMQAHGRDMEKSI